MNQKEDILILEQKMEIFDQNNCETDILQEIFTLCLWAMERLDFYANLPSFISSYQLLMELSQIAEQETVDTAKLIGRCRLELLPVLKILQKDLLQEVPIQVYYTKAAQEEGLLLSDKISLGAKPFMKGFVLPSEEQRRTILQILIVGNGEKIPNELRGILDFVFTRQEFIEHAMKCNPVNIFEYDRLYLSGKLNSLPTRPDIRILITGSSYAMVGLLEQAMPRPAINASVNAQDPYYSIQCAYKAISMRPEIDTILLPLAYYFFFSDLSDNPSDYELSILSFVNIPIFDDRHGYHGPLKTADLEMKPNPVMDSIYPIKTLRQQIVIGMSESLSRMAYFNDIFNPRPSGGMLSYQFIEKSDEQNRKGGSIRANAHNQSYNKKHGRQNLALLDEFLTTMKQEGRKVLLFVPPVTDFYRAAVSREMQDSYYRMVLPMVERHDCVFIDLFASVEFDRTDFQDYDHLNRKGAEKLSRILAGYC